MGIVYLVGAIVSEVFGSSMLKLTATIQSKLPVIGIVVGYILAFYLLSLSLLTIPLSLSYAVWSGLGTALTAIVGFLLFKESVNKHTLVGIAMLIVGVILIQV